MPRSRFFRRAVLVALAAALVFGLMGAAFAVGLHAGAKRTALYRFTRELRAKVFALRHGISAAALTAADRERFAFPEPGEIAKRQAEQIAPADAAEWAGFYQMAVTPADLADLQPLHPWLPTAIGPRLQPWAQLKMEATDGVADDASQICQPSGLFRTTAFSGQFMWIPGRDRVIIAHRPIETAGVQRIYLNRPHPRDLAPTWNGDSIGYWDGDTLVVDTVGFNDKSWLHPTMEPHTEEARFVQRFRRIRGGAYIEAAYTVEDRHALTAAYAYTRYYKRIGDFMPEEICNDDVQIYREFRAGALKAQWERARRIE